MYKPALSLIAAIGLLGLGSLHAQLLTTISLDSGLSGTHNLYSNAAKTTLLTAGNVNNAGDGAVLRLGYYSAGTTSNPFAGTFVALSGSGTLNTAYANTSIGDSPDDAGGNGTFALTLSFAPGSATTGNSLPTAGQQLVIQFFNNTTLATSTLFNAVARPEWVFPAAANPPATLNMSLDQTGLVFLGGASSAFYTSQPVVPEPSTYAMCFMGLALVAYLIRRRQATV